MSMFGGTQNWLQDPVNSTRMQGLGQLLMGADQGKVADISGTSAKLGILQTPFVQQQMQAAKQTQIGPQMPGVQAGGNNLQSLLQSLALLGR